MNTKGNAMPRPASSATRTEKPSLWNSGGSASDMNGLMIYIVNAWTINASSAEPITKTANRSEKRMRQSSGIPGNERVRTRSRSNCRFSGLFFTTSSATVLAKLWRFVAMIWLTDIRWRCSISLEIDNAASRSASSSPSSCKASRFLYRGVPIVFSSVRVAASTW